MRYALLSSSLLVIMLNLQAQKGKSSVMKVRAPLASCTIRFAEPHFLLEKESVIRIRVKGRNPQIRVDVRGGKVVSQNGEEYKLRFFTPGTAVVSVFQLTDRGAKLLATRKAEVKAPQFFFCGLAVDSFSKVLRLSSWHVYAYSSYLKKNLPMKRFDMLYYDTVTDLVSGKRKERIDTLRADTCRLSPEMKKRLHAFQPMSNKIYLYNLVCSLPDGTIRVLEPVELLGFRDTAAMTARPQCIFNLRKKKL